MSFKTYYFSRNKKHNTFIGGVAATIATASDLALILNISLANILNFEISGNDIKAHITADYSIPTKAFEGLLITQFLDKGNLATLGQASFKGSLGATLKVYLPKVTSLGPTINNQFQDVPSSWEIDLPNCTNVPTSFMGNWGPAIPRVINISKCSNIGATKLNNTVFNGTKSSLIVYVPISEMTSNAGSMDGDLQSVIDAGGQVVFVPNYSAPQMIQGATAIPGVSSFQLNFPTPASTNTIDIYEVYINGFWKDYVKVSGESIYGLDSATTYKVSIVPRDIYYNRGIESDEIIVRTLDRV